MPDNSTVGQGFFNAPPGGLLGQWILQRRASRQLNPLREAILQQQQTNPLQNPTTQQQMILQQLQDPKAFARLAGGTEQGAFDLSAQLQPQQPTIEPYTVEHVVDGDSEVGREVGLKPGERGRVRFSYDETGSIVGRPSLVTNPIVPEAQGEGSLPFGSGLDGRSYQYVAEMAPRFSTSSLTPDEERIFMTSVTNLLQPQQYTDPDTGLVVTRRGELPDFARRALQQRGYQVTDQGLVPPNQVPQGPAAAAVNQGAGTIPPDQQVLAPEEGMPTLYEIGQSGDLTGPIPALQRFLTRIPGLGINYDEATSLKQYVTQMNRRVINSLRQNPRYAEGERRDLLSSLELDPKVFDSPQSYTGRVIGIDDALATIEQELTEVVTNRRELVSGETRQMAMDTLNNVRNFRQQLIPPRATTREQVEQIINSGQPGSKFLFKSGDEWIMLEVSPE